MQKKGWRLLFFFDLILSSSQDGQDVGDDFPKAGGMLWNPFKVVVEELVELLAVVIVVSELSVHLGLPLEDLFDNVTPLTHSIVQNLAHSLIVPCGADEDVVEFEQKVGRTIPDQLLMPLGVHNQDGCLPFGPDSLELGVGGTIP